MNETIELRPHPQISKLTSIGYRWLHGTDNKDIPMMYRIIFECKMVNRSIRWNLLDVKHN